MATNYTYNSILHARAQCRICASKPDIHKEDTYFGQTVTSSNTRMIGLGHRNKFLINLALTRKICGILPF